MAASLITCTGNPSALEKLKPIQPLPKCFGSLVIRPLRIGTGKPIDAASNFQPRTFSLNLATNCFGLIRAPDIDYDNFSLHERPLPEYSGEVTGRADRSREDAERSSAAVVLPPCWQASIRLVPRRGTGTIVVGQISNRAADSWQFVAPS